MLETILKVKLKIEFRKFRYTTKTWLQHSRSTHDHIFWFLVDFAGIAIFALCIGLQRFGCQQDMHPWLEIVSSSMCF